MLAALVLGLLITHFNGVSSKPLPATAKPKQLSAK